MVKQLRLTPWPGLICGAVALLDLISFSLEELILESAGDPWERETLDI